MCFVTYVAFQKIQIDSYEEIYLILCFYHLLLLIVVGMIDYHRENIGCSIICEDFSFSRSTSQANGSSFQPIKLCIIITLVADGIYQADAFTLTQESQKEILGCRASCLVVNQQYFLLGELKNLVLW